jgi:hypothetical protein
MKLSISVPDDLWRDARLEDEPNSQTVQEALRMLADRRRAGAPELPGIGWPYGEESEVVVETLDRLADEARALRDKGYTIGFELAQRLSWTLLEKLPSDGSRLRGRLADAHLNMTDGDPLESAMFVTLGTWGDGIPELLDDDGNPLDSPTLFSGMAQAIAEVREAVRRRLDAASLLTEPPR